MFPGESQSTARNRFLRRLGQVSNRIIAIGYADIIGSTGNQLLRRFQSGHKSAGHITHMNHRSPRCTITFNLYFASGVGAGHQIVKNNIASKPGAGPKHGRGPQADNGKIFVPKLLELQFGIPFSSGVSRNGVFITIIFIQFILTI